MFWKSDTMSFTHLKHFLWDFVIIFFIKKIWVDLHFNVEDEYASLSCAHTK